LSEEKQAEYLKLHPTSKFAHVVRHSKVTLKKAVHEQRKFFTEGGAKPGSKQRRGIAQFFKDKAKGLVKAMKHEVKEFKEAGHAVSDLLHGKKLHDHQKKALKTVLIHSAMVIGPMAISGGLSAGLSHVLPHLAGGFLEHSLVMSAGRAAMFASDTPKNSELLEKMLEKFADYIADQDLSSDDWKAAFASSQEHLEKDA
jgi:hypothetical protein